MTRIDSRWRDRVVFIVGSRRSGTNWLHRIVDAHPQISVIPSETYLFSDGVRPLAERVQHGIAGSARTGFVYMDRDRFLDAVRDLCDRVLDGMVEVLPVAPGGMVAERTPDHVRHLELIGAVYPDAWVIHIVRDGRDVARSLVSQDWGPDTVEDAAEEWRSAVEAGRAAAPGLARYLELRYEDLLNDPPRHIRGLFEWLGLDAGEAVIGDVLQHASMRYNVDALDPVVGTGKWRASFTRDEVRAFDRVAGPLLETLGYERGPVAQTQSGRDLPLERASATTRLRDQVRRWRRGRSDDDDERPLERLVQERLNVAHVRVDAFMGDLAALRFDRLSGHFAEAARVRSNGPDGGTPWSAAGLTAVERLIGELRDDTGLRGRQVRADVYPGVPCFAVTMLYEGADGSRHPRVFVIGVAGGAITELGFVR